MTHNLQDALILDPIAWASKHPGDSFSPLHILSLPPPPTLPLSPQTVLSDYQWGGLPICRPVVATVFEFEVNDKWYA